ncbi:hypothetical protein N7474_006263 [Penicillium riverlandense]|uniref:uncharacterized protein n=1 Tax=Penicillium riverlandense TaxID=1903569 RepID=UPI002548B178|nr:uncharacterized protein N7474_006263 [Penicillium riverlandense]KAJ5814486.1 hypothetical protein N7474_006263 [Penicillium riverlandense]
MTESRANAEAALNLNSVKKSLVRWEANFDDLVVDQDTRLMRNAAAHRKSRFRSQPVPRRRVLSVGSGPQFDILFSSDGLVTPMAASSVAAASTCCGVTRRKWLLDADQYHTIFNRIMEIDEARLHLQPGEIPRDDLLPPGEVIYAVTFWSKPQGLDGPWFSVAEHMPLGCFEPGESAVPVSQSAWYFYHPARLMPSILSPRQGTASKSSSRARSMAAALGEVSVA